MSGTKIHPTALVEKGAQLGENVFVGPFCHISSEAVIGDGCSLMSHVVIMGKTTLEPIVKYFHMQFWEQNRKIINIREVIQLSLLVKIVQFVKA